MKNSRCIEPSDTFYLTKGRLYSTNFEYRDRDGDEYVMVINDVGRTIVVRASRFEEVDYVTLRAGLMPR